MFLTSVPPAPPPAPQTQTWSSSSPRMCCRCPSCAPSFTSSCPTLNIWTSVLCCPTWRSGDFPPGTGSPNGDLWDCRVRCVSGSDPVFLASFSRYSLWSRGNTVELRVDLLFLLQSLQEAAGGAAGGGGARLVNMRRAVFPPTTSGALQDSSWGELGLILGCSRQGSGVSCGGVQLSHTPFMALYYR